MGIRPRRIKAAEAFKAKVKNNMTILGTSLEARLHALCAGENFCLFDDPADANKEEEVEDQQSTKCRKLIKASS